MQSGIQPDIIACRAASVVNEKARQKISVFSNVPISRVVSLADSASIYQIPAMLRECGMDFEVLRLLHIEDRIDLRKERQQWATWCDFTDKIGKEKYDVSIGITGKYTSVRDSYASIINALEHSGIALGCRVKINWIDTSEITEKNVGEHLKDVDGIIVPGGFGIRGTEGKILCIKYARMNKIPFLGICLGFQMAVIEFARNVCGLKKANSTEIEPECAQAVIDILPEQKKIEKLGGNMRLGGHDIEIKSDSIAYKLFGNNEKIRMRFRHRYEVDPRYIETLENGGLTFSGKAPNQPIMQILELRDHPYFIATQSHPCLTSRPLRPQPMFTGLVAAAMSAKFPDQKIPKFLQAVEMSCK
jgi:CTP synthase